MTAVQKLLADLNENFILVDSDQYLKLELEQLRRTFIAGEENESLRRRGFHSDAVGREQFIGNMLNEL